ncbi:MAG: glycerol-3-phosphate acyltransferase PlsY [Polyangiales bacterium]|jgi:glycerol-3-phosphate acyltransferase PlsY
MGCVVLAYLLGSVLFGLVVARYHGVDLRNEGSGNPGASNALRTIGKGAGLSVLILDLLKGLLPTLAARFYFDDVSASFVGAAAVLGHCYPVFYGFRGGKGAATGAGVVLAVSPVAGSSALVVFFVLKTLTKKASLGSLGGALVALGIITYEAMSRSRFAFLLLALVLTTLLVWRHRSNIERLKNGDENDA